MTNKDQPQEELSFEASLLRLEQIIEKMHSGATPLDDSLKLYEEADSLINRCSKRLADAEKRVEILIKNRTGDVTFDKEGNPAKESFNGKMQHGS